MTANWGPAIGGGVRLGEAAGTGDLAARTFVCVHEAVIVVNACCGRRLPVTLIRSFAGYRSPSAALPGRRSERLRRHRTGSFRLTGCLGQPFLRTFSRVRGSAKASQAM